MELNRYHPLPWLHSLWLQLSAQHDAGRLAHALLLTGPPGLGKRHLALALGHRLLCPRPVTVDDLVRACGLCSGCRQSAAGAHGDLLIIEPETGDKPIRVDQIRALGEFAGRSSHSGGYRIAVLEPAERMNPNAANALLKTLEEPPPACLLVLVAHRPADLPATVRSRCRRLPVTRPAAAAVLPWLAERLPAGGDAELMLRLARGAPLRALAMAEGSEPARHRECFEEYCAVFRGRISPDQWASRWAGEDAAQILEWLLAWQQDMIRLKLCSQPPPSLANPDLADSLRVLGRAMSVEQLFRQLAAIQALSPVLAAPVNVPLQLAALVSRLHTRPERRV